MSRTLLLIALVAIIPAVWSIRCYVCNSIDNPVGCGHGRDGKDERYSIDCNSNQNPLTHPDNLEYIKDQTYDLCRKIVTSIEFNVNNNTATERITRKCGYLSSKYDEECYYRGGFGGRQRTCTCKTDGCNSAIVTGGNAALLMGAVGIVYAFAKF